MEGAQAAASGGSGPAPFLLKTYDMVDDSATDEIVSWSASKSSFVVWNPPEFSRLLLPTYFKHNNFSSFIRQLNTYGFRKIDPEKWEFQNEDFVKDQKHLLKNIHRRKPIHSHSNPQGSLADSERATLDEELEKLSREKSVLEENISHCKQQLMEKPQLEIVTQRVNGIEKRQDDLHSFLEKAVKDPAFVDYLVQKIESMDFGSYNKKRRLPEVEYSQPVVENGFVENHSSSRAEFGNIFHQDFSNKLRLELSPAVSDMHLVSNSTQSSNEDGEILHRKISEPELRGARVRAEGLFLAPEPLELSDTGTSFGFKMDSSLSRKQPTNGSPGLRSLQTNLTSSEEGDGQISCLLNLSLASSPFEVNNHPYSAGMPQLGQGIRKPLELRFGANPRESETRFSSMKKTVADGGKNLPSSQEAATTNQGSVAAPGKVNDVFWEQFLTERPGCSDNEEASSNYRASAYDDLNDGRLGNGLSRSSKNVEQLTL
ncbi:heat stress transcription factor A-5 [Humulus lupulus]|uniref:heat stress transcription factor A-5 n=1 Tax=Humulus lupulus TaxID=3486 RepID=UPI002B400C4A|nr:heat stress transcription factor A-5 [Humulus lupulus]